MSRTIPGWVLVEIMDWMTNARTGELALEYNSGRLQRFRRHETCSPPKDSTAVPGVPHWPTQFCPKDGGPMAEDVTHEKLTCAVCYTTTTIWELRRQGKFAARE